MADKAYITRYASPLGLLTLASDGDHITGLWMEGQKYFAAGQSAQAQEKALPVFDLAAKWLDRYFKGEDPGRLPPLSPRGTPYQQMVWQLLLKTPRGKTTSYSALADALAAAGKPTSPRAVGNAVGHNPISILIPCHRVLGKDGSLTGYAGGADRKTQLLKLEGILPD